MASFQVQAPDGAYSTVSHREFFEVLNNGEGYLYYKQGGKHLAMQPTTSNIEALKACRQAENAENYGFAASSRCLDAKGHLCRYQHDKNGRIIRNDAGNPISAKCGDCPRDGWIAGKRENCCIHDRCNENDCAYCRRHRDYRIPLSLEQFEEDEDSGYGYDGIRFSIADPSVDILADLEADELNSALHFAIIDGLSFDEQAVINAIYHEKHSQRAFASEYGLSRRAVKNIHDHALDTLRNILKDFV